MSNMRHLVTMIPTSQLNRTFSAQLNRAFFIPLLLLAILAGCLLFEIHSLTRAMELVDHAQQVVSSTRQISRHFIDMETGLRGYELTGADEFLQPFYEANKVIDSELDEVARLVSDNPDQQNRLESMRQDFARWRAYAFDMRERRKNGELMSDYRLNLEGKKLMDTVRQSRQNFLTEQEKLREVRVSDWRSKSKFILTSSVLLVFLIGTFLVLLTRREMMSLAKSFAEMADAAQSRAAELERVSAIVESSDDAIIGKTLDGTITSWNRGAEQLYGYSEQEMIGKSLHTLIPADRPNELRDLLARLAQGERIEQYETKRQCKDGHWVDVLVKISPIFDGGGAVVGASSIAHDITERKRAEEAVKQSELRFRGIFEMSADLICVADMNGHFLLVNSSAERILGYTREELTGKPFIEFVAPEDREPTRRIIREKLERGETVISFENRYVRKDGSRVWLEWTSQPLDERRVIAVGRDVTQRKADERELRESEKRFRTLAENVPQMIWVADVEGNFSYLSQKWLEYTGTTYEQNADGGWMKALHPEDVAKTAEAWNKAVSARRVYEAEYRIRRADGEYRWHMARGVPMTDEMGRTFWFGTTMDIHDQKRANEALVRTEKLASAGRMAATVAHEINNPLELITNSVFIASLDENLSERARKSLTTAETELERVAHLTRQTLGFYRENTAPTEFDLAKLVDDVVAIYAPKFIHRHIKVNAKHGRDLKVMAVAGEIRQVISNLIANAIDATSSGNVRVRTSRVPVGGGHRIRLTLADTGEGIAPENLKHLYEPFFTTKETVGTGLGLWVSNEIVKRHHGCIRVRSKIGRGTVFCVFLPEIPHPSETVTGREKVLGSASPHSG